jgi:A/G-specific adenine glycosylase
VKGFSYLIIKWYRRNKRNLPWRQTNDPYRIWVSEVILQQTRVEQGSAYYDRFVERFPDIGSLAEAGEDEVMKIWQGLGYYSRARNMHHSARMLIKDHKGVFPSTYQEIRKMRGVGDYSAGAISSIAFGEPHPAIDGNVQRVVARFTGIYEPVKTSAGMKKVREFLENQIDKDDPGTFNQAVMELGALVCKPKQPDCQECPLGDHCYASVNKLTDKLPVISKIKPPSVRFFHYFVIISRQEDRFFIWMKKRTDDGIWKNLYDFPLIEADHELSREDIEQTGQWNMIRGPHSFLNGKVITGPPYLLTHRELRVIFFMMASDHFHHKNYIKVGLDEFHKYPVPRLIENFMKKVSSRPGIFFKFPD